MTTNIYDILFHDNKYQPDNDVETLGLKQLALSDMAEASVPAATSETYRLGIDKDQNVWIRTFLISPFPNKRGWSVDRNTITLGLGFVVWFVWFDFQFPKASR